MPKNSQVSNGELFPDSILPGAARNVVVSETMPFLKYIFTDDSNQRSVIQSPAHCIESSLGPDFPVPPLPLKSNA